MASKHKMLEEIREFDLTKPRDLIDFLLHADIRLVRFDYLWELARSRRLCPRRQEAEHEEFQGSRGDSCKALVTPEELKTLRFFPGPIRKSFPSTVVEGYFQTPQQRRVLVVSVSHCWESQQHADPWGFQLRCLTDKLATHRNKGFDMWIFLDWICLPQFKRTAAEQQSFQRAMKSMYVPYAHRAVAWVERLVDLTPDEEKVKSPSTVDIYCSATDKFEARPFEELLLNHTLYHQRGWCVAESQWMSTKANLFGIAPMSPATFQERVHQGEARASKGMVLKFTHRSDAELVMELQEKIFQQQAATRILLVASHLPLQEVSLLCESLPCFESLYTLCLSDSQAAIVEIGCILKILKTRDPEQRDPMMIPWFTSKPTTQTHTLPILF